MENYIIPENTQPGKNSTFIKFTNKKIQYDYLQQVAIQQ